MLSRLFCLSGGGGGAANWASQAQYDQLGTASARSRVLEVLEEELEARCAALSHPAAARASQDAAQLRRLYRANLPSTELGLGKELLRKLAVVDQTRQAAESTQQQLQAQLKAAEAAHRQAEFARARAEAIATARGEALMHAQQATRDAEMQQLQLAEVLKAALPQLGIDISPLLAPNGPSPLLLAPPDAPADSVTPPPRHSGIFSKQQLAAVAASISKLPRQSLAGPPPQEEQLAGGEWGAVCQRRGRRSRRQSREGSRAREAARQQELPPVPASDGEGAQLSGFTVYTNKLQGPECGGQDDGEVAQAAPTQAAAPEAEAPLAPLARDSQGSGVAWRSISSAALSSRSNASAGEEEQRVQEEEEERRQAARRPAHGSRGSSRQRRQQRPLVDSNDGSLQAANAPLPGPEPWQAGGNKSQQRAHHLPKLVLPGLDASQMDSLVRIGASMQSPDPHAGTAAAIHAPSLPPGPPAARWDSSANPMQSGADTERFLAELQAEAEAQRQGTLPAGVPAGSRRHSRGGSSGASADSGDQARQAAGERVPLHQLYAQGSKYPGAGTWVSPSMAAMIAHKKGHNPFLDGAQPSPPSHIKAVFGTSEDKEFYGPMAAHLNKREPAAGEARRPPAQPPAPRRHPAGASADSIQGPARLAASNNSSADGSGEWPARHQQPQWQEQPLAHPTAATRAAAAAQRSNAAFGAAAASEGPAQPQQQPPPKRRQSAFLNRFQPMGRYAQQAALPAPTQQQQQQGGAPRRSSVAVSQLGGSREGSRGRRSADATDENLAVLAASKASLRGSGLPPRQQAVAAAAQEPATKRSLDSMRASVGGAAAAANFSTSINAVEAAMAALRDANPHLRDSAAPPQLAQQDARSSGGSEGGAAAAPRHARARSLPDPSSLDLPLHALGSSAERQRREQALLAQQAMAGQGRRQY